MAGITDELQVKAWTWSSLHGDHTLNLLLTVDSAQFDGSEADVEVAIGKALAAVEKSLRLNVTAHRQPAGTADWSAV